MQDSSSISLPPELADRWPGCGGNASQAALKLQIRWEIRQGTLHGSLETGRSSDQTADIGWEDLTPGSLRLADLGYFNVAQLAEMNRRQVYFLSRIQVGTTVFDEKGQRIAFWSMLENHSGATWERPVPLSLKTRLSCRLVALRCPPEVVAQRLERLQIDATRHGRPISHRQRQACAWTVLVTNVPKTRLKSDEMWTLYRVRWQIELLFKLWKQNNRLSRPHPGPPQRMLTEVYAKLLGVIVQHWTLLCSGGVKEDWSMSKAARWFGYHAIVLAKIVSQGSWYLLGTLLRDLRDEMALAARISRRQKRPSTYQTLESIDDPEPKLS